MPLPMRPPSEQLEILNSVRIDSLKGEELKRAFAHYVYGASVDRAESVDDVSALAYPLMLWTTSYYGDGAWKAEEVKVVGFDRKRDLLYLPLNEDGAAFSRESSYFYTTKEAAEQECDRQNKVNYDPEKDVDRLKDLLRTHVVKFELCQIAFEITGNVTIYPGQFVAMVGKFSLPGSDPITAYLRAVLAKVVNSYHLELP